MREAATGLPLIFFLQDMRIETKKQVLCLFLEMRQIGKQYAAKA